MQKPNKISETKYPVRFSDCDPFKHLNNSKYIEYCLNAREDHLLQFHDFSVNEWVKTKGCGWIITKNEIIYQRPAQVMETVVIQSVILKIDLRTILVEMRMWDEQKSHLKSLLWTTFFYWNIDSQRPEKHEAGFLELFRQFEEPLPEGLPINERARQLQSGS